MRKFIFLIIIAIVSSCSNDDGTNNTNRITSGKNEILMCTFDPISANENNTNKPDAAIINWPRWETGQIVKIKFLDGDDAAQEKVKKYASEWTNYANLIFEYVAKEEYADIRIAFNIGRPGAWSALGKRSAYGNGDYQNQPSMRLGALTGNENTIRRTILHEFGHALGLIHENASPAANISWNLPKVYQYYSDTMGWSKEYVDDFVLKSPEQTNYSAYDNQSIMHYFIDPSLTTNGIGVQEKTELSAIDMISINEWYPFPFRSTIESGERIDFIPWTKPIKSQNGQFVLIYSLGILSIYDAKNKAIIWQVGNPLYNDAFCTLEFNGNISIQNNDFFGSVNTVWSSNTAEFSGAKLLLQDDGNLELIQNDVVRWSSTRGKI